MHTPGRLLPFGSAAAAGWRRWRAVLLVVFGAWASACASLPDHVERPRSTAWASPEQTPLGQLVQQRRQQAKARAESAFLLLDREDLALSSRLALVERAQKTLDLQYYAVHADASTELILQGLRAAARRGVRVRILLDDFNSVGEDAQVLRLAFEPGIEVRLFNPTPGPRDSLVTRVLGSLHDVERLQKRMHNKLFLADSAWGITGGRNLGDAYFGGDDKAAFVDLDVLAAGEVVKAMAASFDRYWNHELAYPVQALLSPEDLERLREQAPDRSAQKQGDSLPVSTASKAASSAAPSAGAVLPNVSHGELAAARMPALDLQKVPLVWAGATLLVDRPGKVGPGDDEVNAGDTLVDGLLQLMQGAQREVVVLSPYFVPGEQMMQVLAQLRRRNVVVRVLTNSLASTDAVAAHAGYRRHRERLLALGIELHEMRAHAQSIAPRGRPPGSGSAWSAGSAAGGSKGSASRASLHSKAVLVDRRLAVIGSMNLDLRSQLKNSEVALVIRSAPLATAAVQLVERSIATGAYRLELLDGRIVWRAPAGAAYGDATSEPEAGTRRRLLVNLLAPFAPDEML